MGRVHAGLPRSRDCVRAAAGRVEKVPASLIFSVFPATIQPPVTVRTRVDPPPAE